MTDTRAPREPASGTARCACGAPVSIRKTTECRACYQRRWEREAPPKSCLDCGQPTSSRTATLCDQCRRRRVSSRRPFLADPQNYAAAHRRIRRTRGAASAWECHDCRSRKAEQWAYRAGSPRERVTLETYGKRTRRRVWSPEPIDYDPLCLACHVARDHGPIPGYRNDPEKRREYAARWRRAHYDKQTSTDEGRDAYRARKNHERRAARGTPPDTLTTTQVAARLGVHRSTVIRWADTGRLPHTRTRRGDRRFPIDVVVQPATTESKNGVRATLTPNRKEA